MKAIVIVANGWHTGWLGCYGNEWIRTHNLDRLAAESVVFDQHFAVEPALDRWFESIATGRYSSEARPVSPSLFTTLRQYGIRTVRVHDVKEISPAQDGGHWDESIAVGRGTGDGPGEAIYLQIDDTLQRLAGVEQWLLWIETDRFVPPWDVSLDFFDEYAQDMAFLEEGEEPHPWDEPPLGPREVTDREFERLQATCASVLTEWDVELAEWNELFREHELDKSAAWIVTSGFGLSLGEHGWIGPSGRRPFAELGHVPLLVRLPNAEQGGRRVGKLTASIDLAPALFEMFALPMASGIHGASLLPLCRGGSRELHSYIRQSLAADGNVEGALRTPDWTCMQSANQPNLLFRKPEDRWEVNDLRQKFLEWAEHLEAVAIAHRRDPDRPPALKKYDEVMTNDTKEDDDEHGASGERIDRPSQSESSLRGHQGDQED